MKFETVLGLLWCSLVWACAQTHSTNEYAVRYASGYPDPAVTQGYSALISSYFNTTPPEWILTASPLDITEPCFLSRFAGVGSDLEANLNTKLHDHFIVNIFSSLTAFKNTPTQGDVAAEDLWITGLQTNYAAVHSDIPLDAVYAELDYRNAPPIFLLPGHYLISIFSHQGTKGWGWVESSTPLTGDYIATDNVSGKAYLWTQVPGLGATTGVSALDVYAHPKQELSPPPLTIQRTNNAILLSWTSQFGVHYQPEILSAPNRWDPLGEVLYGTGQTQCIDCDSSTNTVQLLRLRCFYP